MGLTSYFAGRAIGALVARFVKPVLVRSGQLTRAIQWLNGLRFRLLGVPSNQIDLIPLRKDVLRRLRSLQIVLPLQNDPYNVHYGEFSGSPGRFGSIAPTEPWMYQTLWATRVIAARDPSNAHVVRVATNGIEGLLARRRDNRIHATSSMSARDDPHHRQLSVISIRHTICAALLFRVALPGGHSSSRSIIGSMTDPDNKWQNKDGGWAKGQDEDSGQARGYQDYRASDLWGSSYAAELLELSLIQEDLSTAAREQQTQALERTLRYLKDCWQRNHWKIRGSPAEENAVLMLTELAPVLSVRDRPFLEDVVRYCKDWMNPNGGLKDSYVKACAVHPDVTRAALYARMSYALYRAGEARDVWLPLYIEAVNEFQKNSERAPQEKSAGRLSSADLSFLLDLSYAAEQPTGSTLISKS
jgi:hypothetical protein